MKMKKVLTAIPEDLLEKMKELGLNRSEFIRISIMKNLTGIYKVKKLRKKAG